MRLRSLVLIVSVILFLCTESFAKRAEQPVLSPIVYKGIEYQIEYQEYVLSAEAADPKQAHVRMRVYLTAVDLNTKQRLWRKPIYERTSDSALEKDVQSVFVKEFVLVEENSVIIVNEAAETFIYRIDSQTIYTVPVGESDTIVHDDSTEPTAQCVGN